MCPGCHSKLNANSLAVKLLKNQRVIDKKWGCVLDVTASLSLTLAVKLLKNQIATDRKCLDVSGAELKRNRIQLMFCICSICFCDGSACRMPDWP